MNSLSQNRVGKYLLYAMGEIVLVIVGILIALQINNLNELRKNEDRIKAILLDVQRDLSADLDDLETTIAIYEQKDSLVNLALSDTLTEQDYQQNPQLIMLLTTYTAFESKDNAYQNLMRNSDFIPNQYNELVPKLDRIYLENTISIKRIQNEIEELVNSTLREWSDNHTWYKDLNLGRYNPDFVDFFLNDPYYKNDLVTYRIYASGNLLRMLKRQQLLAVQAYKAIHNTLNNEDALPAIVSEYMMELSEDQMQSLSGNYHSPFGISIKLYEDEGSFYGQVKGQSSFSLYAKSDSVLFNPVIGLSLSFHTEDQAPISFTFRQNQQELVFTRAEEKHAE